MAPKKEVLVSGVVGRRFVFPFMWTSLDPSPGGPIPLSSPRGRPHPVWGSGRGCEVYVLVETSLPRDKGVHRGVSPTDEVLTKVETPNSD